MQSVAVQKKMLESKQTELNQSLHIIRENLKMGNKEKANSIAEQAKELIITIQSDPNAKADLHFIVTPADFTIEYQKFG